MEGGQESHWEVEDGVADAQAALEYGDLGLLPCVVVDWDVEDAPRLRRRVSCPEEAVGRDRASVVAGLTPTEAEAKVCQGSRG